MVFRLWRVLGAGARPLNAKIAKNIRKERKEGRLPLEVMNIEVRDGVP